MPKKYLIIGYESDQNTFHYDVLFAASEAAARQRIARLRDSDDFDVLDMPALKRMTDRILAVSRREADAWIAELEAESGKFRFRMSYRCPNDGREWESEWSCACNDRCPQCDAEIEPHHVEDMDEQSTDGIRRRDSRPNKRTIRDAPGTGD